MTPEELLRSEAGKWLRQAAKDLNAGRALGTAERLSRQIRSLLSGVEAG